jgi:hypothetical protein
MYWTALGVTSGQIAVKLFLFLLQFDLFFFYSYNLFHNLISCPIKGQPDEIALMATQLFILKPAEVGGAQCEPLVGERVKVAGTIKQEGDYSLLFDDALRASSNK